MTFWYDPELLSCLGVRLITWRTLLSSISRSNLKTVGRERIWGPCFLSFPFEKTIHVHMTPHSFRFVYVSKHLKQKVINAIQSWFNVTLWKRTWTFVACTCYVSKTVASHLECLFWHHGSSQPWVFTKQKQLNTIQSSHTKQIWHLSRPHTARKLRQNCINKRTQTSSFSCGAPPCVVLKHSALITATCRVGV